MGSREERQRSTSCKTLTALQDQFEALLRRVKNDLPVIRCGRLLVLVGCSEVLVSR